MKDIFINTLLLLIAILILGTLIMREGLFFTFLCIGSSAILIKTLVEIYLIIKDFLKSYEKH